MNVDEQCLRLLGQRPRRTVKSLSQPRDASHQPMNLRETEAEADRLFRWRMELLTMREAAIEFKHAGRRGGKDPGNSFYVWCRKHALQLRRSGTLTLVRRGDVLRVLDGQGNDYLVERARASRDQAKAGRRG